MTRKESFQIGKVRFKWGDTLAYIKAQLSIADVFVENDNPYALDKTLTIKLVEMWTIKTSSCEFSAPADDRLVDRIWINIAADNQRPSYSWLRVFRKHPLIKKLNEQLGSPLTYSLGENNGSGSVVENATWAFDNCEVGISIYGRIREENDETNIGLLYINLKDIELLDSLYSQPLKDIEKFLQNKIDLTTIKTFQMQFNQRASWSMEAYNFPQYSINFVSRAYNGFHNRALFQTPLQIQAQLKPYEVCTWQATTGDYYFSNAYETIALKHSLKTSWSNILPAKGSGHGSISIGGFNISNEHSRPETQELVRHLEQILDIRIICYEDYDC